MHQTPPTHDVRLGSLPYLVIVPRSCCAAAIVTAMRQVQGQHLEFYTFSYIADGSTHIYA
jgi:hypothetical protein